MRCVVDTNVIVSAAIFAHSVPRQAVEKTLRDDILLFSDFTMEEMKSVLFRPKFDPYVSREERAIFLAQLSARGEFVPVIQLVHECRDPKDDKFLEVALNGRADAVITGDIDLLALNPWRKVIITSPADYLAR